MSLNDFIQPNVFDCYWTLFIFSVLLLSTDHYLQDSKKNERTAHSHFPKGPRYEVLVAYTTWGVIVKNTEDYISFSIKVKVDKYVDKDGNERTNKMELRFIDSIKFMSSCLDSLVNNLTT